MNSIFEYSPKLNKILLILLLVQWSMCSYLDVIYKTMVPKNWISGRNQNRYLRIKQQPVHFNPEQSNKIYFPSNDHDDYQSKSHLNTERQGQSSVLDQQSLEQPEFLNQQHRQISMNQQQSNQELNANRIEQNEQVNCKPIIKTKYIAIEIPKIVRVPNNSNNLNRYSEPSNTESTSILPPHNPSTHSSDLTSDLNSSSQSKNDELTGKTRIITIRELPNSISKTIVVNSYESKNIESNSRSMENKKSMMKKNNLKPSRVQLPGQTTFTTYVGFEDY